MDAFGIDIVLRLYPSIQEIKESSLTNSYMGGLDEFYKSIHTLLQSFEDEFYKIDNAQDREKFPSVKGPLGSRIHRNAPLTIAEIVMYLGTSGITVAVYELLRLWVESRNGRKIRIKMGDFEVEATQMSVKEFQRLFEILNEHRKSDILEERQDEIRAKFLSEGFILISGEQRLRDQQELNKAVHESRRKAAGEE